MYYPVPGQPNLYIECSNGKPIVMKCAPSTYWVPPMETCSYESDYKDYLASLGKSQDTSSLLGKSSFGKSSFGKYDQQQLAVYPTYGGVDTTSYVGANTYNPPRIITTLSQPQIQPQIQPPPPQKFGPPINGGPIGGPINGGLPPLQSFLPPNQNGYGRAILGGPSPNFGTNAYPSFPQAGFNLPNFIGLPNQDPGTVIIGGMGPGVSKNLGGIPPIYSQLYPSGQDVSNPNYYQQTNQGYIPSQTDFTSSTANQQIPRSGLDTSQNVLFQDRVYNQGYIPGQTDFTSSTINQQIPRSGLDTSQNVLSQGRAFYQDYSSQPSKTDLGIPYTVNSQNTPYIISDNHLSDLIRYLNQALSQNPSVGNSASYAPDDSGLTWNFNSLNSRRKRNSSPI
ncbi:unnamed protein product [Gordionus sp. m RMFG-2023]